MDRTFTEAQIRTVAQALQACRGIFQTSPILSAMSKINLDAVLSDALSVLYGEDANGSQSS